MAVAKIANYQTAPLEKAYEFAKGVDVATIAQSVGGKSGAGDAIRLAVQQARVQAIKKGIFS